MKIRRFLSVLLVLTLSALLLTACEGKKDAWTLDEALKMVGSDQAAALNGRIPLSDDFSGYDCFSDGEYIADSGKILILQREGPEKEYSRSTFPYPDDYRGEDKGTAKVWLRTDLMSRIPEHRRAATAEEAETIIMAESYYQWTSTMESQGESISGMNYDEYRPLFCAFNEVRLYSRENKGGQTVIWEEYCYPEMRDDPESAALWSVIGTLKEMTELTQSELKGEQFQTFTYYLDILDGYGALPRSALERLYELGLDGDTEEIRDICTDTLWKKAQEFITLDPDYAEEFSAVVDKKSYEALEELVVSRDYSNVALTDSEILIRKAYMGTPDPEGLESLIEEAFFFLDEIEWNMTDARRILMYGY